MECVTVIAIQLFHLAKTVSEDRIFPEMAARAGIEPGSEIWPSPASHLPIVGYGSQELDSIPDYPVPSGELFTGYASEGWVSVAPWISAICLTQRIVHAWQQRPSASTWKHSGSCVVNERARETPIRR